MNRAWRDLVTELLQLPANFVRPANQNAGAEGLEDQFITILIGSVTGLGAIEDRIDIPNSNDLLFKIQAQRKATATIQAFGPDSFDLLLKLNALMSESQWSTWQFQQSNMGLIDIRGPNDLTALVPALLWQRRAVLSADFYFIINAQVRVPCFASFSWDVILDQDGEAHFEWNVNDPFPKCPVGGKKHTWPSRPLLPPLGVASLSLSRSAALGGSALIGRVTLNGTAPAGGAVVTLGANVAVGGLSRNASAVEIPSSVTVPANATSTTFILRTTPVDEHTPFIISASHGAATQTIPFTVHALQILSITLNPAFVVGGTSSTGTVRLTGPAPDTGAVVALSSSDSDVAQVPPSVTVERNATAATFRITTTPITP